MPERVEPDDRAPRQFDLVIIGGGSGNSIINREFSHLSIALIDDGAHFGGTCLNAGCIPTKMFVHVADVAADAADGSRLGLHSLPPRVEWESIRDRVFTRTDGLSEAGFRNRDVKIPNVTVFRESFGFESRHVLVSASGERIRGERIVIAAGSRPRPLVAAYEPGPGIHDSDSIMRIDELPTSLVIIGGGAVAVEFAHIFSALGVEVTQVIRGQRLLSSMDVDVSARFTEFAATQWRLLTGTTVESIERGDRLSLQLDKGDTLEAESVLVALGRIPNTDTLALEAAGFDLHADGRLAVDDRQRALVGGRPAAGIYGLGDVSSEWQLKHVANHQARIVQNNLLHPDDQVGGGDPGPVPAAIFSRPQVAHFGLTEVEAPNAVVVTRDYSSTAYGWALEDTTSFCKLVVDSGSGLILGAHIIGPEASILIQPLVLAASRGLSIRGLARSMYWPHPAASEVVENALLDAEKELAQERVSTQE
ncbi:mycothione reductase [Glaciihabitans sp. UYNi722]|uniref:mycothione reductase n=1 Tax=Glaciihabitans sp. UYNi722 TaxID=3156344 RepID=UPI0033982AA8